MNYIDLFCGAGGFSIGFNKVGFKNVFALDINKEWCETYKNFFPQHKVICEDIKEFSDIQIKQLCKGKKIDVIIGGPPCQGFSIAGNIGRTFVDDHRNHLFKEFARTVSVVQPKYFVMENVARLYSHRSGKTREEIVRTFLNLGYQTSAQIVNSVDFGVPQKRRRVIFIGTKSRDKIICSLRKQKKISTVKDSISDLPVLKSGQKSSFPNHEAMTHTRQMLEKMRYVSDGGNRVEIPAELRPKSGDARKYIRYNSAEPSVCITGDMRKVFHYKENRALTVRELARLQTFPDDFIFVGTRISQQQQVGNAVPPLLAEEIAVCIKKMIKGINE